MRYRALVGLTLPANEKEADRLRKARDAGSPIPFVKRNLIRVESGQIATFIPEESLPWLLEQGMIEVIDG